MSSQSSKVRPGVSTEIISPIVFYSKIRLGLLFIKKKIFSFDWLLVVDRLNSLEATDE